MRLVPNGHRCPGPARERDLAAQLTAVCERVDTAVGGSSKAQPCAPRSQWPLGNLK